MTSITCSAPGCRRRVDRADRVGCITHHGMLPPEIRRALRDSNTANPALAAAFKSHASEEVRGKWEIAVRRATEFWRDEFNRQLRRGL